MSKMRVLDNGKNKAAHSEKSEGDLKCKSMSGGSVKHQKLFGLGSWARARKVEPAPTLRNHAHSVTI